MMVSTKGRYALRVMVDLAEHNTGDWIPLKDIAARQDISLKYLESIMAVLAKADYVRSLHGKGGGYQLSRLPNEYTVGSILKLTEGSLAPVACLTEGNSGCARAEQCRTLSMWAGLDRLIDDYLEGIRVSDLMQNVACGNYVI
jgi:Rrf2 family iron-sulfur cluster assembly transcriptional regulator